MRAWALAALLLSVALAGCSVPDDAPDFGITCPTWYASKNSFRATLNWFQNDTVTPQEDKDSLSGEGLLANGSRPLDRFEVRIGRVAVEDASLSLRAYAGEGGRALDLRDEGGRDPRRAITFDEPVGGLNLTVDLSPGDGPPAPAPLYLLWSFQGDLDADGGTASGAVAEYTVHLWYLAEACA